MRAPWKTKKGRKDYLEMTSFEFIEEVIANAHESHGDRGLLTWIETPIPELDGKTPREIMGNPDKRLLLLHTRRMLFNKPGRDVGETV
jgi:hypothetical protein